MCTSFAITVSGRIRAKGPIEAPSPMLAPSIIEFALISVLSAMSQFFRIQPAPILTP